MTPRPPRVLARRAATGFTLLELLIAITVLAFVSMIAWRGLDALLKTRYACLTETRKAGIERLVAQRRGE